MKKLYLILINILFVSIGNSQIAVIAHNEVAADSISKNQLLDFYSGDIQEWDNNLSLIVYDLPKLETRDAFLKYLGKSSSRMKSIWLKKLLLGESDPPKVLNSEKEMLETIAKTPGSIGFINYRLVDKTVKVLKLIE